MAETQEQINERMARARAARKPTNPDLLGDELAEYREIIRWLAPKLYCLSAIGHKMTNKCIICAHTRTRPTECKHNEIWRLANES